jgi:hypothetical protein
VPASFRVPLVGVIPGDLAAALLATISCGSRTATAAERDGRAYMTGMAVHLPGDVLNRLAELAAPLCPLDRVAFISAGVHMLQQEADPGPGTVDRIARSLLAQGVYRRDVVTGVGRPLRGSHHGYDRKGRRGRHGKPPPADDDAA